jgi:hypothetical protein
VTLVSVRTIPNEQPRFVSKVQYQLLRIEGFHTVSTVDPHDRILSFLEQTPVFSFKQLLNCTHEAEWALFQTPRYFSENLVAPGIEPAPLTSGPQRRSQYSLMTPSVAESVGSIKWWDNGTRVAEAVKPVIPASRYYPSLSLRSLSLHSWTTRTQLKSIRMLPNHFVNHINCYEH